MTQSSILVIIVTWNGMRWIARCLDSVTESDKQADIFVVDNGSTDGTLELLRARKDIILRESRENLGFGAANNIGMRYALDHGYDCVFLLNQDAYLLHDTLGLLYEALCQDTGIISPIQMNGNLQDLDRNFANKCLPALNAAGDRDLVEVPLVMAALWMIPRTCLEKVGLFSPAFHHYGEDDNYVDRVHYHGLSCAVLRTARAIHDRPNRPNPKDKKLRIRCVGAVRKISDPNANLFVRKLTQPLWLLYVGIVNLSGEVLRFIPKLIRNYPTLTLLRRQTMSEGAFLQ